MSSVTESPPPQRLQSLDALRGFDMFWIVGGEGIVHGLAALTGWWLLEGMKKQLMHVPWNGFTAYDLIFPLFLFIAGVTLPLSIGRNLEQEFGAGTVPLAPGLEDCAPGIAAGAARAHL